MTIENLLRLHGHDVTKVERPDGTMEFLPKRDSVTTESAKLPTSMHGSTIPRDRTKDMVLRQVGWLGHRDGTVYALGDNPLGDGREKGGVSPLYGTIGVWRDWDGDGRYVIQD